MVVLQLDTGQELDLMDGVPISLNFSIADIKEPNKRNASFSKSIMLAGSKNNNDILTHIYKINKSGGYNPNIKQKASLLQGGVIILDGYIQLLEIVTEENQIVYKVVLYGDNGDFMSEIEGLLLSDINFADLNHTLTVSSISTSWLATTGQGYMYPLVDNGFTDGVTWDVGGFAPAIYVKEYIDRMFVNAGYTYTSTFIDSSYFKSLIIPYTGGQLKLSEGAQRSKAFKHTQTIGQSFSGAWTRMLFPTEDYDYGNNGSQSQYVVPTTGSYICQISINFTVIGGRASIVIINNRKGTGTAIYERAIDNTNAVINKKTPVVNLQKGDSIEVWAHNISPNTFSGGYGYFKIKSQNDILAIGDDINMNLTTSDIKQTDLFMSLVKMHNLYVSPDPLNKNNLLIEPREDYYTSSTQDWTDKLDRSQSLNIKPLGEQGGKNYIFKYKADRDFYNKDYQDEYPDETYGQKKVTSTNEFLKNDVKTEIVFSPTVIVGSRTNTDNEKLQVPHLGKNEYTTNGRSISETNIKILMFSGIKNCPKWIIRDDVPLFNVYIYPYCSHLDDPITPTVDISFGAPRKLYSDMDYYTNNNLYNKYWSKFIEEILDPDSKLVTGKFLLDASDINSLDFAKQYLIDNVLYRLNNIKNYDPTKERSLCTVEFTKLKEAIVFSPSTVSSFGGVKKEI